MSSYEWRFIGGHLALDLANTMAWRLDPARSVDRLGSAALLADWFRTATGLSLPADDHVLDRVRRLRGATIRLVDAHLDGVAADAGSSPLVHAAWRSALARATPGERLPLTETPAAAIEDHLALAVAELLHRPDPGPLRRCDGDGCGWLFLDTTRNHSRRWCDSADCGNRARVRAYTGRRRDRAQDGT
ncbi:CGNR zinc finger domain-containing protein [Dactylosporangium sp. NPDC051541]|uniref:CGNR zinc finger domain-containing protein n=1 Tax=Dactylosporangium sp. NPDC051541 TaxID=3363977 RepID=UPI0037A9AEE0